MLSVTLQYSEFILTLPETEALSEPPDIPMEYEEAPVVALLGVES